MTVRPYRRCQECGTKYPAPRAKVRCDDCLREQTTLFGKVATMPKGFIPICRDESSEDVPA